MRARERARTRFHERVSKNAACYAPPARMRRTSSRTSCDSSSSRRSVCDPRRARRAAPSERRASIAARSWWILVRCSAGGERGALAKELFELP